MNKLILGLMAIVINISLFSCTKETLAEEEILLQGCCGDGADIPPPPPKGD